MDVSWRPIIDDTQLGNWCRTTYGENQCTIGNEKNVGSGIIVEGIQRCFCMDIQIFKRDPPELAQHKIELDIIIPLAHQVVYRLNHATRIKEDIDKLLTIGFI